MTPRSKKTPASSNSGGAAATKRPRRPTTDVARSDAQPTTSPRPAHRPPDAGVARDAVLMVRVTEGEKQTIKNAAQGNVSEWCRRVLMEAAR